MKQGLGKLVSGFALSFFWSRFTTINCLFSLKYFDKKCIQLIGRLFMMAAVAQMNFIVKTQQAFFQEFSIK